MQIVIRWDRVSSNIWNIKWWERFQW